MDQNLHSFPETKCGTEDLEGAGQLDDNGSSSLVDVAGCTPVASAESSQPHANSCAETLSAMKGTLDKEQETDKVRNRHTVKFKVRPAVMHNFITYIPGIPAKFQKVHFGTFLNFGGFFGKCEIAWPNLQSSKVTRPVL
ncbi:hypothetical protein ACLOJK_025691 [Asimina triloba]